MIGPELSDDQMTALAEAAQSGEGNGNVSVLSHDRLDAINAQAECIITINGQEYWCIVEDGNINGTQIVAWEDEGQKTFEPYQHIQYALVPKAHIIERHRQCDNLHNLLRMWDAFLERKGVYDIISSYMYDRRVQPSRVVENYYRQRASKYGFEIVTKEEADATRKYMKNYQSRGNE